MLLTNFVSVEGDAIQLRDLLRSRAL